MTLRIWLLFIGSVLLILLSVSGLVLCVRGIIVIADTPSAYAVDVVLITSCLIGVGFGFAVIATYDKGRVNKILIGILIALLIVISTFVIYLVATEWDLMRTEYAIVPASVVIIGLYIACLAVKEPKISMPAN